jgi:hypothetical protein
VRKYKRWARHHSCEPYLDEFEEPFMPEWEEMRPFVGKWIGIRDRRIVASGTAEEVVQQEPGATLYKVPEVGSNYVLHLY